MITALDYDALTEPFPADAIKQRRGGGNSMLKYIDAATVIRRLNRTCPTWNFEVLREWTDGTFHKVHGRLTIPPLGSREHMGVQVISGRPGTEDVESKGAVSDCLKKCATLFGVGIELYGEDHDHQPDAPHAPQSAPKPAQASTPAPPPMGVTSDKDAPIMPSQIDTITTLKQQIGLSAEQFTKGLEVNYGKDDLMNLTQGEGTNLINRLMEKRPAAQPSMLPADRATTSRN